MDKNDVRLCKKYLSRKMKIVLAAAFLVIGIVALFIGTFIQGGGPIGLPVAAAAIVVVVVLLAGRVSDKEFDETVSKYISHRNDRPYIAAYDLKDKHTVEGKDGKARSSKFFYTEIQSGKEEMTVNVQYADLLTGTVTTNEYTVNKSAVRLKKEELKIAGVVKKCPYLACETFFTDIPVDLTSLESSKVVDGLFSTNS